MSVRTVDAVVIGAGPNGLVAANALVDAGWDVLVLEEQDAVGGAVRTAEVTAPGFRTDLFSAFYPLAAASPVIRDLHLGDHGLVWTHAPDVLAHPLEDGRVALLRRQAADTAEGLDTWAGGDGDAWLRMVEDWRAIRDPLLDALFTPFPPAGAALRLLRRTGAAGGLDLARLAVLPVLRLAEETFGGEGATLLLVGNALHADVPPSAPGSAVYGWLLAMLGQDVGFPVPRGGAGALAGALTARVRAGGGAVETGTRVDAVAVAGGRAVGVLTAGGERVRARHAVIADVTAPALYGDLLAAHHVPLALRRRLERFQWDHAAFKLNWALDRPVPWAAAGAGSAGTVHLGVDVPGAVDVAADLAAARVPRNPFLLFGQMTTADPTRSPVGTESAWAYTHLPHGLDWGPDDVARQVERMEAAVERAAPGFGEAIRARHVQSPHDLEGADANLVGGAVNGGTAALHQQLFFRPTAGLGRPETPVEGLFLGSASAHPGGGVHGACGWNAARAALAAAGPTGPVRRVLARTAWARVLGRT